MDGQIDMKRREIKQLTINTLRAIHKFISQKKTFKDFAVFFQPPISFTTF